MLQEDYVNFNNTCSNFDFQYIALAVVFLRW